MQHCTADQNCSNSCGAIELRALAADGAPRTVVVSCTAGVLLATTIGPGRSPLPGVGAAIGCLHLRSRHDCLRMPADRGHWQVGPHNSE